MQEQSPLQRILFGSPGTGKSHHVKTVILPSLGIEPSGSNCIATVFHPEYSYGDFMGKLLPLTDRNKVEYRYHAGHFLRALARAYRNLLLSEEAANVALVIDEINRGNSAGIFGTVFQLLDRDNDGWSSYEVDISDMEFDTLLQSMGVIINNRFYDTNNKLSETIYEFNNNKYTTNQLSDLFSPLNVGPRKIKLPPNLSLIATMNNSDSSIYYMDTAFKRRWDWQYVDIDSSPSIVAGNAFNDRASWEKFVNKLNNFIRSNHKYVRKVEEKQIGYWFVSSSSNQVITKSQIQNKVMFYLWDSVFNNNRKPLADLLHINNEDLVTFGDFVKHVDNFLTSINKE